MPTLGAPLSFMKESDNLKDTVDYSAFNKLTKRNNARILTADDIFDRIGNSAFFLKLI